MASRQNTQQQIETFSGLFSLVSRLSSVVGQNKGNTRITETNLDSCINAHDVFLSLCGSHGFQLKTKAK